MGTAVQVKADAMRNVCQRKVVRTNPKGAKMECLFADGPSILSLEMGIVRERQRSGPRVLGLFGHELPSFPSRGSEPFYAARCPHVGRGIEGHVKNCKSGLNPLRGPSAALTAPNAMTTPGRCLRQGGLASFFWTAPNYLKLGISSWPPRFGHVLELTFWSLPSMYLNIGARTMPKATSAGAHWQ